jgi:hypothetical protein
MNSVNRELHVKANTTLSCVHGLFMAVHGVNAWPYASSGVNTANVYWHKCAITDRSRFSSFTAAVSVRPEARSAVNALSASLTSARAFPLPPCDRPLGPDCGTPFA